MPAAEFHQLWGGDKTPQFPDDGSMPQWHTYFPPIGGFRFGLFTIPPDIAAEDQAFFNAEEAVADLEAKLPGLVGYMDPTDPGMHATDTIDFEVVLEGTVVLELDDGAEVTLHAGDTVVQNGTRHRWKNPGEHARPDGVVHLRRVSRQCAAPLIRSGARGPRNPGAPACLRRRRRWRRLAARG